MTDDRIIHVNQHTWETIELARMLTREGADDFVASAVEHYATSVTVRDRHEQVAIRRESGLEDIGMNIHLRRWTPEEVAALDRPTGIDIPTTLATPADHEAAFMAESFADTLEDVRDDGLAEDDAFAAAEAIQAARDAMSDRFDGR